MDPASSRPASQTPETTAALPGARTALILLLLINLFNYIDRQVLSAVVSPIGKEFFPEQKSDAVDPTTQLNEENATSGQAGARKTDQHAGEDKSNRALIGTLNSAFMISYMLLAPLFGPLADRFSRWKLIGIGVIGWTLASAGSGWAPTFGILWLTRCFVGVGEAAYGPAAPTIIADFYPVRVRGKVLAWFYAAIPVGSALGYILGGQAYQLTGNWRWAFWAVLPPGLILGIWCFFMPELPRGSADRGNLHKSRSVRWRDYLVLLRTPSYVLVVLGMTAMTFAMGGIAYWMPTYIVEDRHHWSLAGVNTLFGAIVVVAGLTATLLGGFAGDKLRPRYPGSYFLVSGLAMLAGFPMFLLVIWIPFPYAWIFLFLACFCLFFNTGPTNTVVANVSHPSMRATAFALTILVIHVLGDAFSPAIIGSIADQFGPLHGMDVAFAIVALLILVGGICWLFGTRYLERDTLLAPTRMEAD